MEGRSAVIKSFPPKEQERVIALTFDDGPHAILTPKLISHLRNYQAKVTFFVMGIKVNDHPTVLKQMLEDGHEIGNHGWNHPVMSKMSFDSVHDQLQRTNEAITNATKFVPTIMRPPYGNTNDRLNKYINNHDKYDVVLWSLDTLDWKRPSYQIIVDRVLQTVKPGDVILCHDIHPGTVEAILYIVGNLTKQGYAFKTISQLIQQYQLPQ